MKTENSESESLWTKAPVANLVRYEPSGIYFARAKVRGKLVRKSLDTNVLSVAKLRLGHKDGGVLAMQTYGHLRDGHSANMALKVIFGEVATPDVVTPPKQNPPVTVASANSNKTAAQAKAAYSCPWWASSNWKARAHDAPLRW